MYSKYYDANATNTMWHRATIQSRKQLSPTVTGLTLQIHQSTPQPSKSHSSSSFTFLPGQWVDFQPHHTSWKPTNSNHQLSNLHDGNKDGSKIPIGGYSITSIPKSLPFIDLAIQSSRHPVATWITTSAGVGDVVNLRVGGSFTYATADTTTTTTTTTTTAENDASNKTNTKQRLLFVAGGVGINPLFSMIQQWHFDQQRETNDDHNTTQLSRAVLLYSAKRKQDLLFVTELNKMVDELSDCFRVVLTSTAATKGNPAVGSEATSSKNDCVGSLKDGSRSNIIFRNGRVDHDMIQDAVHWLNKMDNATLRVDEEQKKVDEDGMIVDQVYVCGPPGMPEDIQRLLIPSSPSQKDDIRFVRSEDDVNFEKWW